jgi:succinate dehydrogenase / fumarate reductase iron-sulfur subunit
MKIPLGVIASVSLAAWPRWGGVCLALAPHRAATEAYFGAEASQLALLPRGHPERAARARSMVAVIDNLGFGNCSNEAECEAVCPKEFSVSNIARMRREYMRARLVGIDG